MAFNFLKDGFENIDEFKEKTNFWMCFKITFSAYRSFSFGKLSGVLINNLIG